MFRLPAYCRAKGINFSNSLEEALKTVALGFDSPPHLPLHTHTHTTSVIVLPQVLRVLGGARNHPRKGMMYVCLLPRSRLSSVSFHCAWHSPLITSLITPLIAPLIASLVAPLVALFRRMMVVRAIHPLTALMGTKKR
jgi:hypothetical protein